MATPIKPSHIKLGSQSIQSGAYKFIPIPFVDDWLLSRQRKSMVESILKKRGLTFDEDVPPILIGRSPTILGRVSSLVKGAIMKPLKKVFRTLFFWLTARSAAVTVLETYFLGRLLHHPSIIGQQTPLHLTEADAVRISKAYETAIKNIDLKAVASLVSKVNPLLKFKKPTQEKASEIRETIEREKPNLAEDFDRKISELLS